MTAEVWCERCAAPSVKVVVTTTGSHTLCKEHAAMLEFQIGSANFNGGRKR